MTESSKSSPVGIFLLGTLFALAATLCGALFGALFVRFLGNEVTNGWDGIAQGLGGLMLGAAIGLVLSFLLLIPLVRRGEKAIGLAALGIMGLAVLVFLVLLVSRPERSASEPVVPPKKAFQPITRIDLRVARADEHLRALSSDDVPFQWASYKVESFGLSFGRKGPHLDVEDFGPDRRFCSTPISEDDLRALIAVLEPAMRLSGICRTPEDDLPISFGWRLSDHDPDRGNATTESGCLAERPEIVAVARAMDKLAERRVGELECRKL